MKGNVDDVEAYLVEYQPYEQNGAGVRISTEYSKARYQTMLAKCDLIALTKYQILSTPHLGSSYLMI